MKWTILAVVLAGVVCLGAGDANRKAASINYHDTQNGSRLWVQTPNVTIVENGPGWVRFRWPNGSETYYSGDYQIFY
jgi:hypothetical protein